MENKQIMYVGSTGFNPYFNGSSTSTKPKKVKAYYYGDVSILILMDLVLLHF